MKNSTFFGNAGWHWTLRVVALVLATCLMISAVPFSAAAAQANGATFKAGKVLFREKDFTITAREMTKQKNSGNIELKLTVKNTGKETLRFQDAYGEIEHCSMSLPAFESIQPGNQATIQMYIDMLAMAAAGFKRIEELDVTFAVYNEDTRKMQYEDCTMTIPLGVTVDLEYNPYNVCLYEEDSFNLYLLGAAQPNPNAAPRLIFRLENDLDGPLVVRDQFAFSANKMQYDFYVDDTATAYKSCVFSAHALENFYDDLKGNTASLQFQLQICTGNWNPLVDILVKLDINRDSEILRCTPTAVKSKAYEISMGEYNQRKNMFMGAFHNYQPNPLYIASLRNKYPDDLERYSEIGIFPYVSELLKLYLDDLEKAGYDFGVKERGDLCTETSYVVELTEQGESVIQVAFTLEEFDPKAARIMALGCMTDQFQDLDKLNSYLRAMWIAFDTLNIHMTEEKHAQLIQNSETATDPRYGVMLRGQYDGLGYLQSTSEKEAYLTISPDLSLPIFAGMKVDPKLTEDLNVGDTFFFGSYEQDNNTANGPEDIEWVILQKEVGSVLAISTQALDSQRFHKTAGNVAWRNASVRTWLNQDFYNAAFDAEEQARIIPEKVDTLAGKDKVFLLSRDEAEVYFPTAAERQCVATAYAVSRNAYVNAKTGGSWWLLRTAGTQPGCVMSVNSDGTMDYAGGTVQSDKGTVRPAMWIRTTS